MFSMNRSAALSRESGFAPVRNSSFSRPPDWQKSMAKQFFRRRSAPITRSNCFLKSNNQLAHSKEAQRQKKGTLSDENYTPFHTARSGRLFQHRMGAAHQPNHKS